MPRKNANVRQSNAKRVKHTNASPSTRKKRERTRTFVTDPNTGMPTIAWKPRRRAA